MDFCLSNLLCTQILYRDPFENFLIFKVMFETACASQNFQFRLSMAKIVDRLYHPLMHIRQSRSLKWWNKQRKRALWICQNHVIDASFIEYLDVNLKRI